MTKKEKVFNWVNKNYSGFEFWYECTNGRYGRSWSFLNKETKEYIHIYNESKTDDYEVSFYEDAVEYGEVQICVNNETQEIKKEMQWKRKNAYGSKPTLKTMVNI